MEDADLRCLEIEQDFADVSKILRRFVENNVQVTSFDDLNKNGKRQKLFTILFQYLGNPEAHACHKDCLHSLRILSRDKSELNTIIDDAKISILLHMSRIFTADETYTKLHETGDADIIVAALKALCNLAFNCTVAVTSVAKSHAVEGILMRLRMYREPGVPHDVKLFDMQLLFLVTALVPEIRPRLKEELHGLIYLTETLDLILKESEVSAADCHRMVITDKDVDLSTAILKVLFNLLTRGPGGSVGAMGGSLPPEDAEDPVLLRLTSILHDLLLAETSPEKCDELRSHTVDLLTSIPPNCYSELLSKAQPGDPHPEDSEMEAVNVLLDFLQTRLSQELSKSRQDLLSPILSVLLQMSRSVRLIRKHIRRRVLPPLTDTSQRPEQGEGLRAHLCRLLTSPSPTVKDLAAELLFTLCKENVSRMVKHTGYGNAAGMFANRGLLLCGQHSHSSSSYSSDSDSDTEEYLRTVDQINPVLGCVEPKRPNPLEGMSDEQKEYEAMKLAGLLDNLTRGGLIKPCKIGEDGRPVPIEHVLELQEELPRQQLKNQD